MQRLILYANMKVFLFMALILTAFCSQTNQGRRLRKESHRCTNSINNSHQKLVSPRPSTDDRDSSSLCWPCCDVKSLLNPSKAEGDIFTGSGMKAAILTSNSFNVSLLIDIKRTKIPAVCQQEAISRKRVPC